MAIKEYLFPIRMDEKDYSNHGDLKYYFPEYLKEKVCRGK